ncbi:hypothetical protein FIBSPDRAFT_935416 [Athelia psychrophila]|uniref:Uncharacterized protein n=1 Tax=Athelia psychrophila TaxID=1759441 RepID=A0A166DSZ6_9AGAM|nr:hypothetical protein FIBSPDRAFT_935416 [Fibularhizoctonia sp. CBS 109695]
MNQGVGNDAERMGAAAGDGVVVAVDEDEEVKEDTFAFSVSFPQFVENAGKNPPSFPFRSLRSSGTRTKHRPRSERRRDGTSRGSCRMPVAHMGTCSASSRYGPVTSALPHRPAPMVATPAATPAAVAGVAVALAGVTSISPGAIARAAAGVGVAAASRRIAPGRSVTATHASHPPPPPSARPLIVPSRIIAPSSMVPGASGRAHRKVVIWLEGHDPILDADALPAVDGDVRVGHDPHRAAPAQIAGVGRVVAPVHARRSMSASPSLSSAGGCRWTGGTRGTGAQGSSRAGRGRGGRSRCARGRGCCRWACCCAWASRWRRGGIYVRAGVGVGGEGCGGGGARPKGKMHVSKQALRDKGRSRDGISMRMG